MMPREKRVYANGVSRLTQRLRSDRYTGILFIAPCLIFLALVSVYPELFALKMSFYDWKLTRASGRVSFVGLANYLSVLSDYRFWNALRVTALYAFPCVVLEIFLGVAIALLLNRPIKGRNVARALLTLPMVMSPLATGILFRVMYHPEYGIINQILSMFGMSGRLWLATPSLALPAVILSDVWQWTPFVALVALAGLESLPREPLEAALVDGANQLQSFCYVTLPLISKLLMIVVLLRSLDLVRAFDNIFVMTKGGPGISTEAVALFIYKEGFNFFNIGRASAASWITLILVSVFTVGWRRIREAGYRS